MNPHDSIRWREMAAIHVAKKELGLDDDTYRDVLLPRIEANLPPAGPCGW